MTSSFRPLLIPGARLYRLGPESALIGSNPGTRVSLRPGVFELLRLLNGARNFDVLQRLVLREVPEFHGHVRDVLIPLIQRGAILANRPPEFRLSFPTLSTDGPARGFTTRLRSALKAATVETDDPDESFPWHIMVSTGEPPRSVLDHFLAAGIPHLAVVLDEDEVHLGPLTIPTTTPCLSCYDNHRERLEPQWHVLTTQFGTGRVECGVSLATQFTAIATLLDALERDGGDSLIARRLTVSADGNQRLARFGLAPNCHCHLLVA